MIGALVTDPLGWDVFLCAIKCICYARLPLIRKSKKKKVIEQKEAAVVVLDVDSRDDNLPQTAIGEVGWHVLAPLSSMAKVSAYYQYYFQCLSFIIRISF
uniref:Uncharacterized protein n=1 Tax=Parascaris equorum TaxID=6256 RepID=A0A914RGW9_PAREQ